jgi:NADPH-dependent 2,4-dienoyl-CoA reductase/sulfur reductase-like enzyme
MIHYPYLIVGGGMTADAAARAIRESDPKSSVGLISAEPHPPDARPPLSKGLWKGDPEAGIWKGTETAGVELRTGEGLAGLTPSAGKVIVKTTSGQEIPVDVVVVGLGIQPNVALAEQAGVRVDNGILVDELLRTSIPDVFAAGDVANFFNPALGTRMRVEHEDNATTMGAAAGRAMARQGAPYTHLPFFYSDSFAQGYEAVGELDPRLETVTDWKEPFREGVVYYLKDGRVRGVLLWNTWGQVDAARALIAEPGPFRTENLKGRLPA